MVLEYSHSTSGYTLLLANGFILYWSQYLEPGHLQDNAWVLSASVLHQFCFYLVLLVFFFSPWFSPCFEPVLSFSACSFLLLFLVRSCLLTVCTNQVIPWLDLLPTPLLMSRNSPMFPPFFPATWSSQQLQDTFFQFQLSIAAKLVAVYQTQ